jgi:hypothetical protein
MVPEVHHGEEMAEPTQVALALVEGSIARLAAAVVELARSRAWQDVLATVDHLAALLGAEVGPAPGPAPADADPAEIARFVAGWMESLLLPEYLESAAPGGLAPRAPAGGSARGWAGRPRRLPRVPALRLDSGGRRRHGAPGVDGGGRRAASRLPPPARPIGCRSSWISVRRVAPGATWSPAPDG